MVSVTPFHHPWHYHPPKSGVVDFSDRKAYEQIPPTVTIAISSPNAVATQMDNALKTRQFQDRAAFPDVIEVGLPVQVASPTATVTVDIGSMLGDISSFTTTVSTTTGSVGQNQVNVGNETSVTSVTTAPTAIVSALNQMTDQAASTGMSAIVGPPLLGSSMSTSSAITTAGNGESVVNIFSSLLSAISPPSTFTISNTTSDPITSNGSTAFSSMTSSLTTTSSSILNSQSPNTNVTTVTSIPSQTQTQNQPTNDPTQYVPTPAPTIQTTTINKSTINKLTLVAALVPLCCVLIALASGLSLWYKKRHQPNGDQSDGIRKEQETIWLGMDLPRDPRGDYQGKNDDGQAGLSRVEEMPDEYGYRGFRGFDFGLSHSHGHNYGHGPAHAQAQAHNYNHGLGGTHGERNGSESDHNHKFAAGFRDTLHSNWTKIKSRNEGVATGEGYRGTNSGNTRGVVTYLAPTHENGTGNGNANDHANNDTNACASTGGGYGNGNSGQRYYANRPVPVEGERTVMERLREELTR